MAKYLKFDLALFGIDGLIPLKRGDDWNLTGKVVLQRGDQEDDVDLTGVTAASAYFPAASGGLVSAVVAFVDRPSGKVSLSLAKADTVNVALSQAGIAPYLVLSDPSGLTTVGPQDNPIEVEDRGFDAN